MQMWMVWLIWGVFLMVIFGLIANAVSECKGYAKSWFYAGLFLGPIAILILLSRPDPEGQVRYIDLRKPMDQQRADGTPKTAELKDESGADGTAADGSKAGEAGAGKAGSKAGKAGDAGSKAGGTGADKAGDDGADKAGEDGATGDWICPLCGMRNPRGRSWCDACGSKKE